MLFIGQTRFSLLEPGSVAWQASNGTRFNTVDEYSEHLFADERLAPRADIFINESLPQIEAGIGNHDVLHIVSYSEALPTKYQDALERAAERYSFVVLDRRLGGRPPTYQNQMAKEDEVAREAVSRIKPEGGVFGRFRLDDDDLLPTTYFDQVAQHVIPAHVGYMVSIGSGYTGIRIGSDYYDLRRAYYPMLALGLLSICKVTSTGIIIAPAMASHAESDRTNPVILDSRGAGYFWGRHPQQDTVLGRRASSDTEIINSLRDSISSYSAIDETDDLKALFPTVWHKMHPETGPSRRGTNLLAGPVEVGDNYSRYSFESISGRLEISVALECSDEPTTRNALVSFDLSGTAGSPLSDELAAELLRAGILRSANEEIGYYKYLPTHEGTISIEYVFDLPDGVECRGVSVRRFGKKTTTIWMTSLSFAGTSEAPSS